MSKPITPQEAKASLDIDPRVSEVVNKLIVAKLVGREAVILQSDIVDGLVAQGVERADVFTQGLLNFESFYEAAGWEVKYDKPGYNEVYQAHFTFTAKVG